MLCPCQNRLVRLVRLGRAMKIMSEGLDLTQLVFIPTTTIYIFNVMFITLLVINLGACFWIFIAYVQFPGETWMSDVQGVVSQTLSLPRHRCGADLSSGTFIQGCAAHGIAHNCMRHVVSAAIPVL